MKQRYKAFSRVYAKHACGHTMIAYSGMENVCKCGYKFTVDNGSFSHFSDQKVQFPGFPKALRRGLWREKTTGELKMTPATVTLEPFFFNIGKTTKNLLKEIEALGKDHYISVSLFGDTKCVDGRTRKSTISIDYHHKKATLTCWIDLYGKYDYRKPNNKQINDRLRDFKNDMLALHANKKPEKFGDSRRVVVETIMEYSY